MMTRRLLHLIVLLPLLAVLSASALADRRLAVPYEKEIHFTRADFSFAGGPHELRTAVYGNPFGGDDGRLQSIVIDAMQTTNWHWRALKPNMTFTPGPGSEDWRSLHIAVYLDAVPPGEVEAYCRAAGDVAFRPPTEAIGVRFVFCKGAELFSTTVATMPRVASPQDEDFRKLISEMTRGLWPIRYVDVQLGSSQVFLEYRQRNTTHPELFGFGYNTVRQFLGPGGGRGGARR